MALQDFDCELRPLASTDIKAVTELAVSCTGCERDVQEAMLTRAVTGTGSKGIHLVAIVRGQLIGWSRASLFEAPSDTMMNFRRKARVGDRSVLAGALAIVGMSVACGGRSQIDPNIETQWARTTLSPTTESSFYSAAVDSSGNVYAAGDLWGPGTLDFGNGVTPTGVSNGYNVLLVKYDSSGTAQWGQTSTAQPGQTVSAGSNGSGFYSVAVDFSGNVYAAGFTSGTSEPVDFGNGVTVTRSDTFCNAVLVKYNSSGTAQWAQAVSAGSSDSSFKSVAVDSSDNVYAAGQIEGTGT